MYSRRIYLAFAVGLALLLPAGASAEEGLTLSQAMVKANVISETLASREADLKIAEARYRSAFGDIYPKIHLMGSQRLQDESGNAFSGQSDTMDGDFNSGSTPGHKNRRDAYINIRQPIFTGFRDINLVRSSKAQMRALQLDTAREEEILAKSVSEAFYQVLLYRSDLAQLGKAGEALNDRVRELRRFIELGKAKESEILAAQTDILDLEATKEQTKGAIAASEELLGFFIGEGARDIKLSLEGAERLVPSTLDEYLTRVRTRADVSSQHEQEIAAKNNLLAAKGARYPVISAEVSYYAYENPNIPRDWEAFLRFDLPLFEGFKIDAKIAEQEQLLTQAKLKAREIRRKSEEEVRSAYAKMVAAREESKKLLELLAANRKNYDSQRKDYELGVVSNIDVLQALRHLHDGERRSNGARLNYQLAIFELEAAAGGIKL